MTHDSSTVKIAKVQPQPFLEKITDDKDWARIFYQVRLILLVLGLLKVFFMIKISPKGFLSLRISEQEMFVEEATARPEWGSNPRYGRMSLEQVALQHPKYFISLTQKGDTENGQIRYW